MFSSITTWTTNLQTYTDDTCMPAKSFEPKVAQNILKEFIQDFEFLFNKCRVCKYASIRSYIVLEAFDLMHEPELLYHTSPSKTDVKYLEVISDKYYRLRMLSSHFRESKSVW
jgi:hypothetical protein